MSGTIIVVKAARCHFLDLPAKQQVTGNPCLESKAAKKLNQIDPCSIWLTSFHLADETEGKVSNHHSSGGFQSTQILQELQLCGEASGPQQP